MEKISLESLNLSSEEYTVGIEVGGQKVLIRQYLPLEEKMSLLDMVIENSLSIDTHLVDVTMADVLFHLYLVMSYSNLEIKLKDEETEEDKTFEIYDLLERNGIIDTICAAIPEIEYNAMVESLQDAIEARDKFNTSFIGRLASTLALLPENLDKINENLGNLDLTQFEPLMDAMKTVGGNPDAVTNVLLGQK